MRKLAVFNTVSLDGYFTDANSDSTWAHSEDAEWNAFVADNAKGGGELVFGRITYDLMIAFWPTPAAMEAAPDVAKGMNELPKVVFSRTLKSASWNNTRLFSGDPAVEIAKLKQEPGLDMVVMGSGSIVAQLAEAGLIDDYQIVLMPIVLGAGRTMFEGISQLDLTLSSSRAFRNGNMFMRYAPKA
jgi:dihydrofolate reductase